MPVTSGPVGHRRVRAPASPPGSGAMVGALGGLDGLVFTGGIGEHSSEVRARVSERFAFLGLQLDHAANEAEPVDADVTVPGAAVRVLVVQAREELAISRAVRGLLGDLRRPGLLEPIGPRCDGPTRACQA